VAASDYRTTVLPPRDRSFVASTREDEIRASPEGRIAWIVDLARRFIVGNEDPTVVYFLAFEEEWPKLRILLGVVAVRVDLRRSRCSPVVLFGPDLLRERGHGGEHRKPW
jgi:hypothetical protein